MRRLSALLVTAILVAPAATRADGSIALNARAGIAKPFGDGSKGHALGDSIGWAFPLQADLQFRFLKTFSLGAYVRFAPTTLASKVDDACKAAGASCAAPNDLAFGAIGEYRFSERLEGGPWLGAQVGYEMLKSEQPVGVTKTKTTTSGMELGVSAGMDFELGGLTLGPWVGLNAGQFDKSKWETAAGSGSASITDKAIHGWFQVGLRASLLL